MNIIEQKRDSSRLFLTLTGELTYINSNLTKTQVRNLLTPEVNQLVLDLGAVPFMDSAGIGVIVSLLKEMFGRGGVISLVNVQPNVGKVFWITKLDKVVSIYPTMEEAEMAFSNPLEKVSNVETMGY